MRPVLFRLHGRPVGAYHAFLFLGTLVYLEIVVLAAPVAGLPGGRTLAAAAVLVVLGFAAARLLVELEERARRRLRTGGGATSLGGVLALVAAGPLVAAALQIPVGEFLDVAAAGALAGVAVGRIGCLLDGCCLGHPTAARLAVRDAAGTRRVPVPLLESLLALALVAVVVGAHRAGAASGLPFVLGAAGYAGVRFVLHFLRPRVPVVLGLAQTQLVSAGIALAMLVAAAFVVS